MGTSGSIYALDENLYGRHVNLIGDYTKTKTV